MVLAINCGYYLHYQNGQNVFKWNIKEYDGEEAVIERAELFTLSEANDWFLNTIKGLNTIRNDYYRDTMKET